MAHKSLIQLTPVAVFLSLSTTLYAVRTPSEYVPPSGLVRGGAFIDRFLPIPVSGSLRSDVWGATNVVPRDVNNGLEDDEYSYWGGNIIVGDDGKNHLFVCRWPEDNVKGGGKASGHNTWWAAEVVHAISDGPLGPYKVIDVIGPGVTPEIYRRKDGTFTIGIMGEMAYTGPMLNGPWTKIKATFDCKKEKLNTTCRTYVPRADGSVLMMNKNGYMFISDHGDEHFRQVTDQSVYPKIENDFEDPVIWKDEVQYHLVVNDWRRRYALYMRSPDGIHWKWDPGYAYTPEVMKHEDGTKEQWYKFERAKVRQDQYGRATHMNFAVIDVIKNNDLANDNHSSKNVVIPLVVPRRLELLNQESILLNTEPVQVKILAEEGFQPLEDVDVGSLIFGAPELVNFGKGCKPIKSEAIGSDLMVTFEGRKHGVSQDNFTAKMIGRTKSGGLLMGYVALPGRE
ncbi:glycoside hydrolase family protein [Pontiella agarivorans]|uniref:Glycoside hydrolase family protein n=1 Tax=Pontiella agarivorans TaxID=3038953 RepID=A0ABU5N0Q6_9BACT|nr:glycoside hydrolase family protein [Pontiella agarivorans]MDZ8120004.1 glycoside hydrolase family protein [Pontiella agarivorans]